jgi:hypothetical protein
MNRLKRDAVILSLIENLKKKGSWCGETHILKATYFLQELFDLPLGFEFILYKHGPFSFDLSDEFTAMRADMLLKIQPPNSRQALQHLYLNNPYPDMNKKTEYLIQTPPTQDMDIRRSAMSPVPFHIHFKSHSSISPGSRKTHTITRLRTLFTQSMKSSIFIQKGIMPGF